jgi:serine/threonine protein kinase
MPVTSSVPDNRVNNAPALVGSDAAEAPKGIEAKWSAFKEKVASALSSIRRKDPEPLRPLQTRKVEVGSGSLQAPIKQLRLASDAHVAQQAKDQLQLLEQAEKELVVLESELDKGIHELKQGQVNKGIEGFDPAKLKKVETVEKNGLESAKIDYRSDKLDEGLEKVKKDFGLLELDQVKSQLKHVETVERDGLESAKVEYRIGKTQDGISLQPQPLQKPSDPAKMLAEPDFGALLPDLEKVVSKGAMKDFAKQVGERVTALQGLDRKDPEAIRLRGELKTLGTQLGKVIGDIVAKQPASSQNAFAIALGSEFKAQLWETLRGASSKVPPAFGGSVTETSHDRDFVNQVYNTAAQRLGTHIGEGTTPKLTLNGVEYEQKKILGRGGAGIAYLYENKTGDQVVVKSKGFGADHEQGIGAAELREINNELNAHLALMGDNGEGHENVLKIVGAARTPLGQPVAILEIAKRGDLDTVTGKHDEPGTLETAMKQGLVSKQAAHLLNLLILQDSIKGMAYLQENKGMRQGDFKPSNIFIQGDGKLKIADYGQTTDKLSEKQTDFTGTLDYLPPENFVNAERRDGDITAKADTWAIGILAHQLLKKDHPFDVSKVPGAEPPGAKMKALLLDYAAATGEDRDFVSKLADRYDQTQMVQGVTSADRMLNSLLHPDPEKRPHLSDVLNSSLFEDLGRDGGDITGKVRELLVALATQPLDAKLIKEKSSALGV